MDSDDYGDDFDDTAFLDAATQAEKENSPPFHASPRPLKRRKLGPPGERTPVIPPRQQQQYRRQGPFASSGDDSDGDEFVPAAAASRRRRSPVKHDDSDPTSAKVTAQKRKRRSLQRDADDAEDPENESPRRETLAEKRKNRIHVPTLNLDLTDAFFTQPPREPSPPWKPRGAIWQKPTTTIGIHRSDGLNSARTLSVSSRQSTISRPVSRATKSPGKATPILDLEQTRELPSLPIRNAAALDYDATHELAQELADLPSDAFVSSSSPQKLDDLVLVSERRTRIAAPQTGLRQTTLFGREGIGGEIPQSQVNKRYNFVVDRKEEPPTHHKLDYEAIKKWVYPTNLGTIRDYQYNIVHTGLYHNTLVALPTGLGKTFIAATIMLNWFRWTTEAQIVFVAPTKPLVHQQVDACFYTVGIPRSQTVELTGGVSTGVRAQEWASKRVFFMTPQTLINDLKHGYADPKKIVLLVVDEAHRATGSYAYVEVVSFLRRFNNSFRVLALTATPGADVEAVQKVVDGLDISKVEIRTENSIDISKFIHHRKVEKHVFKNDDELEMCLDLFEKAVKPVFNKVVGLGVFYSSSARDITPYGCMQARKKWFKDGGQRANQGYKAMINAIFTTLSSISQGLELLKFHGIGPFYTKIKEFRDGDPKSKSKYKKEICESEPFKQLMIRLKTWTSNENFVGHPKLDYLQQVVIDHFVSAAEGIDTDRAEADQTRIMVFAHYRDSAEEIVRVLKKHEPMIKPHVFVGQQNSKNSDGMNQKTQLEVIEKFKAGAFNTLIATSIGEEGLDIGEVDLIICYDSKASPIRMLQRMGRTGRKREGKIIMLQMEGKEEKDAAKAKDSYQTMQELIANGDRFTFHEDRRILPRDVQPTVEKRAVEIPPENSQTDCRPVSNQKRGRAPKKPAKKFHMPDGVITGFVTASHMDEEVAPKSRAKVARVYPSEETFQLPPLESVLLDNAATKDLERRYQTVFDDDDALIVGDLDLSAHPGEQRVLSKTHELRRHGVATQTFVAMLQRIHAMNVDSLDKWGKILCHADRDVMPKHVVVPDGQEIPVVQNDVESALWADDDPASQPLPKTKTKPGPKSKAKPAPKPAVLKATSPKAPRAAKTPAPRGRPRKDASNTTPVRKPKAKAPTPKLKTHNWRASDLAGEGASSSPPPTDPQMRFASQAETIGSDDTIGPDDPQDTQAYRLDSDLVGFIAEDDEDLELQMSDSSLPGMSFSGVGKGTQAVVKAARPKRAKKAEKIFTSDPTDDDAMVSSDSDDDRPRMGGGAKSKSMSFVVDSALESEDDAPIVPRRRARRVIDDDDDDDDDD